MIEATPYKVLVCGGRDFADSAMLFGALQGLHDVYGDRLAVIHGDAPGADTLSGIWCKKAQVPCLAHPALFSKYGPGAGKRRNALMLQWWQPDMVLAVPGGSGTHDMTERAKARKIPVMKLFVP